MEDRLFEMRTVAGTKNIPGELCTEVPASEEYRLCVCPYLSCNPTKNKVTLRAGLLVELVTFEGRGLHFFSKEMKPPPTVEARHSPQPQGEASL